MKVSPLIKAVEEKDYGCGVKGWFGPRERQMLDESQKDQF